MKKIFQDLEWALPTIRRMARKNSGLSAIFKKIRRQDRFSYIGDYPIISLIHEVLTEENKKNIKRSQVAYSLRKINEYKKMTKREKKELLNNFKDSLHATKKSQISPRLNKKGGSSI